MLIIQKYIIMSNTSSIFIPNQKILEIIKGNEFLSETFSEEQTDEQKLEHLKYLGSEHSLFHNTFKITDDGIIFFVPNSVQKDLNDAALLSQLVNWAYEDTEYGDDLWGHFELQGDDDVDYNSSYIDPILVIISEYTNTPTQWSSEEQVEAKAMEIVNLLK